MKKILFDIAFVIVLLFLTYVTAEPLNSAQISAHTIQFEMGLKASPFATPTEANLVREDADVQVYRIKLDHFGAGRISLLARGPKGFLYSQSRTLHGLMIVSGFFTGEQSINLIGDFPNRVLVGFEYPYAANDFQKDPGTILQFVRKTPAQIALALVWLARQPWMNPQGLSVMGVQLEKSIYVCTGVNLAAILSENLKEYMHPVLLGPIVSALIAPTLLMDPKQHLPELNFSALVIQTDNDTVIPPVSQRQLWELLKGPKRQVILRGPHVNPDQVELIEQIQKAVLNNL
ncbi:MAG: hypothetical protein JNM24_11950 [Bdellovibrionaceae bacterium]|nr:hypothetical protein [Pseudobdellovibrionaceae bacterium]